MIYNKVTFPKPTHSNIWDSRNEKQKKEEAIPCREVLHGNALFPC